MKTKTRFFNLFLALCLVLGGLAAAAPHSVAARADSKGVSPAGMLNPDGTLKLDADFRGALDLDGYSVQLDPARGPVFTPLAAQDNWEALAEGGGAFTGSIETIVVNGTDVYVGGDFRDAGGNPEADYIAKWDGAWSALGNNGSGDGALSSTVYVIGLYGGTLYVGGDFTTYDSGGSPIADATNLAIWDSAWMEVTGITSPLNNTVSALGFDAANNILYFGGGFTNVNGDGTADYLAGVDFDTSALVTLGSDGSGGGSLNSTVFAIGVDSSGNVYAGGGFTNVNNGGTSLTEADHIAKWDGADWSALGNNGAGVGALTGYVYAIAIDGSNNVYAGGSFSNAAGIATADRIAKWSGSAWSALGSDGAGNGALANSVLEIAINGTDIYAAGLFVGSTGLPTADYVARFNTGTNTWVGLGSNGAGNGALNDDVYGMAFSGGNLYLGGAFYDVNNGGTVLLTADYFAVWSGSAWSTLGDSDGGLTGAVNAIAEIGADVYVGGSFANLGGDPRMSNLVRWDGSAWNPVGNLTTMYRSLDGSVEALAVDGTDLYVGGYFSSAQNEGSSVSGTSRIAKWDGSTWSALGGGVSGAVFALAVDSSHNVYAGGNFTDAASITEADYIAKWNGSAWSALAGNGAGDGALDSYVSALAVSGSNVYVGGSFTSVVNASNTAIPNAAYLAKWNGSVWSAMDGITTPLGSYVSALVISGSDLYAGGQFINLNGMDAADYIAKWNGSAWSAFGDNGGGNGSLNASTRAIVVDGGSVYVGGIFTNVNNGGTSIPEADYLARWDGSDWSAFGNNGAGDGSLNNYVYALAVIDADLWTGGVFTNVNNGGTAIKEADFLAAYGLDHTPPTVVSIVRVNATPTKAASLAYTVTFSESVTGVDTSDFTFTNTGVSGATVSGVSGSGATRTVTVATGSGSGTIRLDLNASGTGIVDTFNNAISGGFTGGQVYTVDKTAPSVVSIVRAEANPSAAAALDFTVTFSESVTGVDATDFALTTTGVSGATVGGVSGLGATRTVTVNTGSGSGTIRLDLKASGTGIADAVTNAIGGGFTGGQVYTINKKLTFRSDGVNDGWVLESTETSGKGGSINSSATTFRLGDYTADKQYRAVLHFDTSALPDTAVITKVTLKIKQSGTPVGSNPFTILSALRVDIRNPRFGSSAALTNSDFHAAASQVNIGAIPNTPVSNWYTRNWASGAFFSYINKVGTTQFRLYFTKGDNDDNAADYMKFFSGDAPTGSRPQLIIEYYVP